MNKTLCIILLGFVLISSGKQDRFDKNIFRSPIDFPISLSGSFGDYRTNHFHSGIDIRTQGVTGKKVYAIADGWVSRIRISPYGYGLAVYLDHPHGFTSLYGHLRSFNSEIAEYIKQKQYELQENEIDYYLNKDEIKISQGDIIALSGNSGSSSGPHIHFEIRDVESQHPLNPLYFGFDVPDQLAPEVYHIRLYPIEPWSAVNGNRTPQNFLLEKKSNIYSNNKPISVEGKIGVGVYSLDKFTNGKYKHCFNALSLKQDGVEIFSFKYEELDFETLRDVNSHMDYEMKLDKKQKITKCFKEPFSRLDFYETLVNDGIIQLDEGESSQFEILLTDNFENTSKISFSLIGSDNEIRKGNETEFVKRLNAGKENVYRDQDVAMYFPVDRLYKDVYLNINKSKNSSLSPEIVLEPKSTPFKDWFTIKISCDTSKTDDIDKLVIARTNNKGEKKLYPSSFKNGWVQAQVKEFGIFSVVEDNEPPQVSFVKINSKTSELILKVTDNYQQISDYEARYNGQWMRLYYDRKYDLLRANLSELNLENGTYDLEVMVYDEQDNLGSLEMKLEN